MAPAELTIKQSKPKEKKYRLTDGGGLCLEVMPIGAKYWRRRYRHPQTKKDRELAIAAYPDVGLKGPRQKTQMKRSY